MSSAFSIDFLEPTSEFKSSVTVLLVDKVWVFIFLVRSQGIFSEFTKIFTFSTSTPTPIVSVLAGIAHNATSSLI